MLFTPIALQYFLKDPLYIENGVHINQLPYTSLQMKTVCSIAHGNIT
jgi:hypothetical protein